MGVLIKGMEMPTSPVLFCIHPDGKVFADLEGNWREYKAVPVPLDIDLLIKCLIENGCTVTKAKDGEGGIYLKGKKLTDEELMDCIMNPREDGES